MVSVVVDVMVVVDVEVSVDGEMKNRLTRLVTLMLELPTKLPSTELAKRRPKSTNLFISAGRITSFLVATRPIYIDGMSQMISAHQLESRTCQLVPNYVHILGFFSRKLKVVHVQGCDD